MTDNDPFAVTNGHLADRLDRIETDVKKIMDTIVNIEGMVSKVVDEIKPTLDKLMEHPMLKVFGIGGKR